MHDHPPHGGTAIGRKYILRNASTSRYASCPDDTEHDHHCAITGLHTALSLVGLPMTSKPSVPLRWSRSPRSLTTREPLQTSRTLDNRTQHHFSYSRSKPLQLLRTVNPSIHQALEHGASSRPIPRHCMESSGLASSAARPARRGTARAFLCRRLTSQPDRWSTWSSPGPLNRRSMTISGSQTTIAGRAALPLTFAEERRGQDGEKDLAEWRLPAGSGRGPSIATQRDIRCS